MGIFKSIKPLYHQAQLPASKHSYKTCEKGFLLMSTLTVTPLLMSVCILIVAYVNHSYLHIKALNLCRKHLLIGQDKIRYQMIKLIKLNPKATSLRLQHDRALQRLRASHANPKLYAVNLILYKAIVTQQKLFALIQKKHILLAKQYGNLQKIALKNELKKLHPNTEVSVESFKFSLKAMQKSSITPSYLPESNFQYQQLVKANWNIRGFNNKFNFLKKKHDTEIKAECGATINQYKGEKWQSVLMKKARL